MQLEQIVLDIEPKHYSQYRSVSETFLTFVKDHQKNISE